MTTITNRPRLSNEFVSTPCPARGWVVVRFGNDIRAKATNLLGCFGDAIAKTEGRPVPDRHRAPIRCADRAEAEQVVADLNEFGAVAMAVCHSHDCGCTPF